MLKRILLWNSSQFCILISCDAWPIKQANTFDLLSCYREKYYKTIIQIYHCRPTNWDEKINVSYTFTKYATTWKNTRFLSFKHKYMFSFFIEKSHLFGSFLKLFITFCNYLILRSILLLDQLLKLVIWKKFQYFFRRKYFAKFSK